MDKSLALLAIILGFTLINGNDLAPPSSLITLEGYNNLITPSYRLNYNHPCNRKCVAGQSYTCYWNFVLHSYEAAGYICALTNNNPALGCIRADGVRNRILVVNYALPGPYIEICENDTIIVDTLNLIHENTTLHWHGIHLRRQSFMDGGPMVTQNKIPPGQSFRYEFQVNQSGSYWWHSHVLDQRGFGIAGPLIIRQPDNANRHFNRYDKDLSEHIILIQDWFVNQNISTVTNIIINGHGYNENATSRKPSDYHRFKVDRNKRYRFRVIYNGNSNCPLEISIDNHTLEVIAVDSFDIDPVLVESFAILSSERLDFVLHALKPVANYWLRVRGFNSCANNKIHQGAVIQYKGASKTDLPTSILSYDYVLNGVQLNPIDKGPSSDPNELTISELNSLYANLWSSSQQFITYYTSFALFTNGQVFSLVIDHIRYLEPTQSLLQSRNLGVNSTFCDKDMLLAEGRNCTVELCECTHVIQVPAFEYVEFVISAETPTGHPVHTHGMSFKVVGSGILGEANIRNIEEIDTVTPLQRRTDDYPVLKDTVQVPGFGYVIIRMFTDNPGFWMYHCHLAVHSENGMQSVLQVGTNEQMVDPPTFFQLD